MAVQGMSQAARCFLPERDTAWKADMKGGWNKDGAGGVTGTALAGEVDGSRGRRHWRPQKAPRGSGLSLVLVEESRLSKLSYGMLLL